MKDMSNCYQMPGMTVLEHGRLVRTYLFDLIGYLKTGQCRFEWKLPSWIDQYGQCLLSQLPPDSILDEYTVYHDCGKPYCRKVDEAGRQHFPNHAAISAQVWGAANGSNEACRLMAMDMDMHCLKADGVEEFAFRPEAATLMLTALAEVHANSTMFGGVDSTGFKIKWKHLDKRGRQVCEAMEKRGSL